MNAMTIGINPGNLQSSGAIAAWTERKVRAALRRFGSRITRVEVHFEDVNGTKVGKAGVRCAMEARINRRKPLAVEHRSRDLYAAIDGAARRLRTAVGRAVDRVTTRAQRTVRRRTAARPAKRVSAGTGPGPGSPADAHRGTVGARVPRAADAGGGGGHVIIAGYGPVGRTLARALGRNGVPVTIIESNARTVATQTLLGRTILHGDATDPAVLASAGIHDAAALAITVPDDAVVCRASEAARALAPEVFIAARARHLSRALRARQMGADAVTVEEMVTADAMAASVAAVLGSRVCRPTPEGAG
ncbi:MAG: NAD-binding protein [Phycisphaerales bacterium]|nr:NAD-binding protein [Phycisphaerales bacterium]